MFCDVFGKIEYAAAFVSVPLLFPDAVAHAYLENF
jgi:hypothetical protein